jgi:transposase-like protein
MERQKFGRELKIEAVRLVKERGVSAAQVARDLDVHENVLRKWGEGIRCRSGSGLSEPWPDEAGAVGNRSLAA